MRVSSIRLLLGCLLIAAVAFGASPSIGLAVANGSFQLDNSKVYGNATLFDGSLIQTAAVSSDLTLGNGARLRLGTESQARIHSDRIVLEKGQTEIASATGYSIEALGLRAAPDSPQSRLVVTYGGPASIQVAALSGSARISGANGVLIANVPAGTALDLNPQAAGAATPSTLSGVLHSRNGAFVLSDEVSRVTYTLLGAGFEPFVGKCVEVTGGIDTATQPATGSSQVIRVLTIHESKGCKRPGAFWHSPTAIVAGVAIAAAGTTAGILSTRGSSTPTVSAE
jgi:hypothetical protein